MCCYAGESWFTNARAAETVNKYSRKAAIVQTGIKTQVVSLTVTLLPRHAHLISGLSTANVVLMQIMGVVSLCIIATCVTLLVINRLSQTYGTE